MFKKFLLVLLFALLGNVERAGAYEYTQDFTRGFYWSQFPIPLKVFVSSPPEGDLLSGIVQQAQSEWENSVGREIWSVNGYETGAFFGNNIRWSNNFAAETGYSPATTLAVTVRYSAGTHFSKTEIILNGENNDLRKNNQGLLRKTILHELGHTLGLGHSQYYSIMGASVSSVQSLQSDDVAGINSVVDETLYRQSVGYISPFSAKNSNDDNAFAACGSVNLQSGPPNSLGSLLLGFFLALFASIIGKYFPNFRANF